MAGRLGNWFKANIGAAFLGAVVGVFVGATALQADADSLARHIEWAIEDQGSTPSCGNTGYYNEIKPIDAQSNYPYHGETGGYGEKNTEDNSRLTAWVEDDFGEHGPLRDAISWQFASRTEVRLICVRNGFDEDNFSYADTGQVKQLHIDNCGREPVLHSFPLRTYEQSIGFQDIRVNCKTNAIGFIITSIYRDSHDNDQVGISDVRFYG